MHLKRWLTSLVALPLLAVLILKGEPLLFTFFLSVVALLAVWEYSRMVMGPGDLKQRISVSHVGSITGLVLVWAAHGGLLAMMPLLLSFHLIVTGLLAVNHYRNDPAISQKVAFQALGSIYISLAISYLVLIRLEPRGAIWVIFVIAVIFAGDTAAYYAGTYWGKHKLCPAVSPGKTVEGACGGLAANLLIGFLFSHFGPSVFPLPETLVFCAAIGIVGQVGDLFESVLKRCVGMKDSGTLLPGHGGILDRIDAMLFALPVAYFLKLFFFTLHLPR